jgi:hypothetical protein
MARRVRVLLPLAVSACVSLTIVVGCGDYRVGYLRRADSGASRLENIPSAAAWLDYFRDQIAAQREREQGPGLIALDRDAGILTVGAPVAAEDSAGAAAGGGQSAVDFSGTNLQVAGVDEADVVKTDGRYLYMLAGSELRIVEIYPADRLGAVATLEIEDIGYGSNELYLRDNKAVVLHTVMVESPLPPPGVRPLPVDVGIEPVLFDAPRIYPVQNRTGVTIVDVSDPQKPQVAARWEFDGFTVTSRMIDGVLHLILNHYPYIPYDLEPAELTLDDVEDIIPKYRLVENSSTEETGQVVTFEDFYRPADPDGLGMTMIVSLDTTAEKPEFSSIGVVADAGTIFATTDSLYLTDPNFDYYYNYRETLDVHKFSLRGGQARYIASGTVEGRLLNQFSMGEYQDHLCVATTTGFPWAWDGNTSKNHMFVLHEKGGALELVGAVEDLAPGEQIYSARFVGDKAFLVTFRQVDPLYAIDLSDPSNPRLAGELKVPGFSEYIHVMDENHLLTLGRDATPEGRVQGLQLSIFDVANLDQPQLVASHQIGTSGTSSEAEWNHKAFTFYPQENLLALPVTVYEQVPGQEWGQYAFSGLMIYRVTAEEGFSLRGQISTAPEDESGYPWYYGWSRGLFVEDHVYAATEIGVRAAPLSSPGEVVAELELAAPKYPGGGVIYIDDSAAAESGAGSSGSEGRPVPDAD